MTITSPIIGFIFFNIIQIRSTEEVPSGWWKCGIFCGMVWSIILNAFTFEIIRKKVRSISRYNDFNPSKIRFVLCWLLVGLLMFGVWVILYLIEHKLMWMHGTWAAFVGLISGPTLQSLLITPSCFTRQETKETLIITLATGVLFIPIQALCLSMCLVLYTESNRNVLALFPFYAVRMTAD